eukprot:Colp12_sorted_trinity150504_noHs@8306
MRSHFLFFGILAISAMSTAMEHASVTVLTHDNIDDVLSEGEWMVDFYAPWCGYCRQLEPVWHEFADVAEKYAVRLGKVDVSHQKELSGRFLITGLPTIYHYKDGELRMYKGARDLDTFEDYLKLKKWKSTDPISFWQSPMALPARLLGKLYLVASKFQEIYELLTEHYGWPIWLIVAAYVGCTLVLGLVIGGLFVTVLSAFAKLTGRHPMAAQIEKEGQKRMQAESTTKSKKSKKVD